ncbi:unnamed protein product [Paramecium sonneborni]|uniref:Cyclic nucleotide-binding domain-containing protein n=1 Tax=Paramecium sonneborni TaxID=65129 RepID=A0A8S1LWP0_9CILI|nr:unnamed protein product [Paramecium sonneborni]
MKYKKNYHLCKDGTYIEFSINNNYQSFRFQQIPDEAIAQLFDFSSNFNQIDNLSESKLSPEIKAYQDTQEKSLYQRCLNAIPVFHPISIGLIAWQFFIVVIIFLYFFYIPLKIAFNNELNSLNPDNSTAVNTFLILSILVFIFDLLVSFNTGYKENGQVIRDRKKVIIHYLIIEFELDLIGVLCLILSYILNNDLLRLLFYLRIYYVIRFDNKIDYQLLLKKKTKGVYLLIKLIIVMLFVAHIMACIFYGISYSEFQKDENTYTTYTDTWIIYNNFVEDNQQILSFSLVEKYLISYYWAITTVSTNGYGDITPKNNSEIGWTLLTMIIAGMVFAFNISSIRETLIDLNQPKIMERNLETILNRYMKMKSISIKTQEKVNDYFQYIWKEERNRNREIEDMLISKLAPDLKLQLQYETYIQFVNCRIFYMMYFSNEFLYQLSYHMEEHTYGPKEELYFEDQQGDNYLMYLQKGDVQIYVESCYNSVVQRTRIDYIDKGKCIGQKSFFLNERFPFKAQTQSWCNIYRVSRVKFVDAIRHHQKDFELFHLVISKRYSEPWEFYTKMDLRCLTCMSDWHQADTCDVTHFNKKDFIFRINVKDDKFKREQFERKRRKQYKSIVIQNQIKRSVQDQIMRMKSNQQKKQQNLDISFEESEEEEEDLIQQQQYQDQIGEIKQILGNILIYLGDNGNSNDKQRVKVFIPQKPQFDPFERSFLQLDYYNKQYFCQMNNPLLEDKSLIEFSIKTSSLVKSQVLYDIPAIAQIQLFDVSQDFDPLFENLNPYKIQSKEIQVFKAEPNRKLYSRLLDVIPIFYPESGGLLIWQLIVVIIIFTYLFYIPFKIGFTDEADDHDVNDALGVKSYLIFSILMLGIDLLVSFNTGIKKRGEVILDRKVIAQKYVIWEFELDLIGVISLILSLLLNNDYIRILFYLRSYYIIRFSEKIDHSLQLRSNWKAAYTVLKLIIVALFVNHLMACFFFGVSFKQFQKDENGISNLPTWIEYNGYFEDEQTIYSLSYWSRYVISFYWATTTVSTVGYGDITPKNDYEIGITLITMIIAGMVFAFNVASIRDVIVQMNSQETRYNSYEAVINRYMKFKNISLSTQAKIIDYYQYIWQDEKNRNRPIEQLLVSKLAPELRQQLQYETYINFVKSKIFWNFDFSETFMRSLVQYMQEESYGPGENIHFDTINPQLWFLQNGEILIYVDYIHSSFSIKTRIDLVKSGQCLGQLSFFTHLRYKFQASTLQYCNMYKLTKNDFLKEIAYFHKDFQIYHYFISKQYTYLSELFNKLELKCYTCQSYNHLADQCDLTHYYPKHLLNQIKIKDDTQQREEFQRKKRFQFNSMSFSEKVQNTIYDFNQRAKRFKRISMKQQIPFEYMFEEQEEEENQEQHQDDISEIKNMLNQITNKIGIKQQYKFKSQNIFIPQKPKYDPYENIYEIDLVKNYEYFYPEYNLDNIIKRIF